MLQYRVPHTIPSKLSALKIKVKKQIIKQSK